MGRLNDFLKMVSQGRVGFAMDEVMTGTHNFLDNAGPSGEHPFEFRVTWGPKHLLEFINPLHPHFMINDLEGMVSIGGWADDIPCKGNLALLYFTEAKIRYTFDFQYNGRNYAFVGEKVDIRPWNLHRTHTTCYGTVTDKENGNEISRSITYFRFATMPAFVASLRFS